MEMRNIFVCCFCAVSKPSETQMQLPMHPRFIRLITPEKLLRGGYTQPRGYADWYLVFTTSRLSPSFRREATISSSRPAENKRWLPSACTTLSEGPLGLSLYLRWNEVRDGARRVRVFSSVRSVYIAPRLRRFICSTGSVLDAGACRFFRNEKDLLVVVGRKSTAKFKAPTYLSKKVSKSRAAAVTSLGLAVVASAAAGVGRS